MGKFYKVETNRSHFRKLSTSRRLNIWSRWSRRNKGKFALFSEWLDMEYKEDEYEEDEK